MSLRLRWIFCCSLVLGLTVSTNLNQADETTKAPSARKSESKKKVEASKPATERDASDEKAEDSEQSKDDNAPPPVSVVLLQKKASALTEKQLIEKINKAWGITLSGTDDKENSEGFVVKGGPGFIIKTSDSQYIMMIGKEPYLDEKTIEEVEELRLKTALKNHKNWLSVDLLSGEKKLSDKEKQREWKRVASLAAELLDDNTLGLILPEPKVIVATSDDTPDLLRQKDPVAALRDGSNVPVVRTDSEDPEMEKAVEEARKTWLDFARAYEKQEEGTESFGVKFPFDAPDNKEFMWVEVTAIDDEYVTGRLANDPVWVKDLKLGSKVKRKVSELADWMYLKDGKMIGGYSVQVLLKRQEAEQKKAE